MVAVFNYRYSTNEVPASKLRTIHREVNRSLGRWVVTVQIKKKFTRSAYFEYPNVVRRRSPKYRAAKLRQVGHDIPNRFSDRMAVFVPANARPTATASGGRVYIKNYFPMRVHQRQELEVLSRRDVAAMKRLGRDELTKAVNDPANRRKRAIRGG